jgi:dienelactone hydrolase
MRSFKICCILIAAIAPAGLICAPPSGAVTPPGSRGSTGAIADKLTTKESWQTPSLEGSDLHPWPPILGEKDRQPTFARELVRLQWRIHDPINVYFLMPMLAPKPPVIIYLYDYTKGTQRYLRNNVCAELTRRAVAAVGFPLMLSQERFYDRGVTQWFVSDLQEALATSAHDVQMVINYLSSRRDVDASRIGIYGQGSGAAVAVLAASADPRIRVLDLEDAWGDWPEFLAKSSIIPEAERANYVKPEFLKKVAALDPVTYLPQLKIPVRSQYMMLKSAVPKEARERIVAALPAQAKQGVDDPTFDWISTTLRQLPSGN